MDTILTDIIHTRLVSAVDEAALTLHRTSFSTVVRDSHDYTCLLMDARGRGIAQASRSIPSFLCTLPVTVDAFLGKWGAAGIQPGDVMGTNDPWLGTGHLPDFTVAVPIYHQGRLVAFAGAIAHLPDVGGRRRAPDSVDLFEEGFQIPLLKIKKQGQWDETFVELLRTNVRVPDEVVGDIHAMVGACERMAQNAAALLGHYGMDDYSALADSLITRTDAAMRRAIAALPQGTFRSRTPVAMMDGSSKEIVCALTVQGDQIDIDFTGTSPQVRGSLNSTLLYTRAYALFAIKAMLLPNAANNDGTGLAIAVRAPDGTMLSAQRPCAVEARAAVGHFVPVAVLNALAEALPDRVPAESTAPVQGIGLRGSKNGVPFAGLIFFAGGQGANSAGDGESCLTFPTNVNCTPVEVIESRYPVRVIEKSLIPGSGGAGEFRGGLGQRVTLQNTGEADLLATVLANRASHPARGRSGGGSGRAERILLNGEPVAASQAIRLRTGDTLTLECPGGGGWGDLARRAPEARARDLQEGFVLAA